MAVTEILIKNTVNQIIRFEEYQNPTTIVPSTHTSAPYHSIALLLPHPESITLAPLLVHTHQQK